MANVGVWCTGMHAPERGGKRARLAHGVHHPGSRVSRRQADSDGAVDQRQNHEPPPHSPQLMAKRIVRIRMRGEGRHIPSAPTDGAGIRSRDVEEARHHQREKHRLAHELACTPGFLGQRRRSFKPAEREDGEDHARQDPAKMMRRCRRIERGNITGTGSRMDEESGRERQHNQQLESTQKQSDPHGQLDAVVRERPDHGKGKQRDQPPRNMDAEP